MTAVFERAACRISHPASQRATGPRPVRVYVCGPMTGWPDFNYPAFHAAARTLAAQGYHVENPARHVDGWEWEDYMRRSITQLVTCDAIALLPGWETSRGARIEAQLATDLGIHRITLNEQRDEE